MRSLLFRCKECEQYTMETICPKCGNKTITPIPPRFSPEDKYGKYRRLIKKEQKQIFD